MASLAETRRQPRLLKLAWCVLVLSCLIGIAAALRRMVALTLPPSSVPQLHDLDVLFQAKATLTWIHISCGLLFAVLVPFQFVASIRTRRAVLHRWTGRILIGCGLVAAVSAIMMSFRSPVGGMNETAATVVFGTLFLFALLRGFAYIRRGNRLLHREWMIRAVAIALGIATVRPIMGVFFATSRLTHLTPHDFFGTAFWIGFTINLVSAEAWLIHTRASRTRELFPQSVGP